jgi:hypothetical protein
VNSLPETSEASIAKGIWFVFNLSNTTIRAWGSTSLGQERVYVDESIVSERQSLARNSEHSFTFNKEQYYIRFKNINILKAQIECNLSKGDVLVQSLQFKQVIVKPKYLIIKIIAAGILGITIASITNTIVQKLGLPSWIAIILIFLSLLVLRLFKMDWIKFSNFEIEDITSKKLRELQP